MKIITNLTFLLLLIGSCSQPKSKEKQAEATKGFPEQAKDMVIYEVNVRQYTPEGTFNAFAAHLPRLEELGVDILWIMPIQPIGEKHRKGGLGSYYSIQDYTAVNPEFGTMEDFKKIVDEAHERGMLVILDWVANHTAFDHAWTEIEGYHNTDSLGNVTWPEGTDWTDVADLNYENMDMQDDMIGALRFWVKEADIDGYRCDVAGFVPMEFWNRAKDSLDVDKDLFMLAEWDEPKMHEDAFHMTYGWGLHHYMNEVAKGEKNADSLVLFIKKDLERYPSNAIRMNFTTNHDENSWNGTVFERFGDGHKAFAVFAFTVQGMPLIYSGQEAGLDERLAFFEKDTIEWDDMKYQDFYASLIDLKKSNPALYNGEYGGQPEFVDVGNPMVIAYTREKEGNRVDVIINLSDDVQSVAIPESWNFSDVFSGAQVSASITELQPYQYFVGSKTAGNE
ncbi:alpha-amylase family glycosyl hydrolase [Ekhidna sp.]|uniref:alpha-amylase family glycosyl hydrolase n=1 Tax=Ekhidna sp. TaxID=2608089 RepID=UPI003CCBE027